MLLRHRRLRGLGMVGDASARVSDAPAKRTARDPDSSAALAGVLCDLARELLTEDKVLRFCADGEHRSTNEGGGPAGAWIQRR